MLNPGDRIGDWEIILPLGQGGMGSVYRCRHALSHRIEAAVKVLKPTDISGARQRFIREAEALHALSHPGIVRVQGFGQDAATGLLWLAMELVHGKNFEHLLEDGEFPSDRALEIFSTVADGLAYAHSRGIVHRDIKPANLMLRADGGAVLLDFGIAVQEGHDRLTQEGVVPGTVAYAAPDTVTVGAHDEALADTYALGQVLCECLTGEFTFPRRPDVDDQRRAIQILKQKLKIKPLDPGPNVPAHVRELVLTATEPDARRRGPPLSEWSRILGHDPALTEETAIAVAPVGLRRKDLAGAADLGDPEGDDIDLDGPSVELMPAQPTLPASSDTLVDLLEEETDVHDRDEGGGFPWAFVVGTALAVVVVGLGVVIALGAIAGGAAWWTLTPTPEVEPATSRLGDVLSPDVPSVDDSEPGGADPDVPAPDLVPGVAPTVVTEPSVRVPPPATSTPTSTTSATEGAGDAKLVVAADQPAKVYLDGKFLRATPVTRRLDAGDYQVRLVASGGRAKAFPVHLESGETARRIWDFGKSEWRSFEGGMNEAKLPARPRVSGLDSKVAAMPPVKACLAESPPGEPVTLRFLVVPDGSVVADAIEPRSLAGGPLERCLFRAIRGLDLGASQAGAAVKVEL